ncbi:unnamed protein product [Brassica oleracea]
MKHKFKQKNQWEWIKQGSVLRKSGKLLAALTRKRAKSKCGRGNLLSSNQTVYFWIAKLVLDSFRIHFRGWCKRNHFGRVCLKDRKWLRLNDLEKMGCELLLAAYTGRRAKWKYKRCVLETFISLDTVAGVKFLTERMEKGNQLGGEKKEKRDELLELNRIVRLCGMLLLVANTRKRSKSTLRHVGYKKLTSSGMSIMVEGKHHNIRYKYRNKHKARYKRRFYWVQGVFPVYVLELKWCKRSRYKTPHSRTEMELQADGAEKSFWKLLATEMKKEIREMLSILTKVMIKWREQKAKHKTCKYKQKGDKQSTRIKLNALAILLATDHGTRGRISMILMFVNMMTVNSEIKKGEGINVKIREILHRVTETVTSSGCQKRGCVTPNMNNEDTIKDIKRRRVQD